MDESEDARVRWWMSLVVCVRVALTGPSGSETERTELWLCNRSERDQSDRESGRAATAVESNRSARGRKSSSSVSKTRERKGMCRWEMIYGQRSGRADPTLDCFGVVASLDGGPVISVHPGRTQVNDVSAHQVNNKCELHSRVRMVMFCESYV